jgi:hypothetical protein
MAGSNIASTIAMTSAAQRVLDATSPSEPEVRLNTTRPEWRRSIVRTLRIINTVSMTYFDAFPLDPVNAMRYLAR